jgi:hypothetical protein
MLSFVVFAIFAYGGIEAVGGLVDKTENPARPWVVTDRRNGRQQYVYLANFDWYNYLYDDSRPTWDHNINIKGGSKALSYMVSGRYYQAKARKSWVMM